MLGILSANNAYDGAKPFLCRCSVESHRGTWEKLPTSATNEQPEARSQSPGCRRACIAWGANIGDPANRTTSSRRESVRCRPSKRAG